MMKKQQFLTNKFNCKQFLATLIIFLILALAQISLITSMTFDNIKSFDEKIGNYGKITIKDNFGIQDLFEAELKTNTDTCTGSCSAEIEIILSQTTSLIDDVRFMTIDSRGMTDEPINSYQFYIQDGFKSVNDYKTQCLQQLNVNGSFSPVCSKVISGTHKEPNWVQYNLRDIKTAGTYNIKLEGSKERTKTVDWQVETQGKLINEWAIWGVNTYIQDAHPEAITIVGGQAQPYGVKIIANVDSTLINVTIGVDCTSDTLQLLDASKQNLSTVAIVGKLGTFTENNTLTAGTSYYLASSGGDRCFENSGVSYPYEGTNINWTGGYADGTDSSGEVYNILDVTTLTTIIGSGIKLSYPSDNFETIEKNITFISNSTVPEGNITNISVYVWNPDTTLFAINTTFPDGSNNVSINGTSINIGSFTFAQGYLWNVLTCAENFTGSDCSFSINNRTFNINSITVNSRTFNNVTTEGASETFILNFTQGSGIQTSTINLIYNGTPHSSAFSISDNEVITSSTITIPSKDIQTTVQFFWSILLDNGDVFNTTKSNQTINILQVSNCSTFSSLIYNYTIFDEEKQTKLNNATIEVALTLFNSQGSTQLLNFSQSYTNTHTATICSNNSLLNSVNFSATSVVKYTSNESRSDNSTNLYAIEYYNILNQTITNSTVPKHIKLYSLKSIDNTHFRLTFRDSFFSLAPNILVQIHRQYVADNVFRIVEIPLTDSNGQTILNLVKNNIIYNFIMIDSGGKVVATFNSITAFCQDFTIGECTINLNAEAVGSTTYNYNSEFDISLTAPTYNNNTKLISISFVTGDLLPKKVSIEVLRNNDFGNRSVCSNSLTSASGTLSCDVSSIIDTDQFLFINTFVDGDQAKMDTINLNADTTNFRVGDGAFYAFLIILFIITLFMDDRQVLVTALGIGWVVVLSLGLLKGTLFGATSGGIWLIVTIIIFLWKLNKEEGI